MVLYVQLLDALRGLPVWEMTLSNDNTNPQHYRSHPSGVECIQITRHMGFNLGNAVKYLWRAGLKENAPTIEDLRKAIWYINDEIQKLEGAAVTARNWAFPLHDDSSHAALSPAPLKLEAEVPAP